MVMMVMKIIVLVNNALGVSECSVKCWHDQWKYELEKI
jgi:hypothetical protein